MMIDKIEDTHLRTKSEELLVTLMDFGAGVPVDRTTVEQMWLLIEDRLETLAAVPFVSRTTIAYMGVAQAVACLGRACLAATTSEAATWGMEFGNHWAAVLEMAGQPSRNALGSIKALLPYTQSPSVENAVAEANPWAGDPWP
jgi:hypothetical protein